MIFRKYMSNADIYTTALNYNKAFQEDEVVSLPVKVNFYLQKNAKALMAMAQELEESRSAILRKYGTPMEDDPDSVTIDPEKVADVNQEISDLFALEQEVTIHQLELDWFENINMTAAQVDAISYMIREIEEEE